jgi:hypothetical protein
MCAVDADADCHAVTLMATGSGLVYARYTDTMFGGGEKIYPHAVREPALERLECRVRYRIGKPCAMSMAAAFEFPGFYRLEIKPRPEGAGDG